MREAIKDVVHLMREAITDVIHLITEVIRDALRGALERNLRPSTATQIRS